MGVMVKKHLGLWQTDAHSGQGDGLSNGFRALLLFTLQLNQVWVHLWVLLFKPDVEKETGNSEV